MLELQMEDPFFLSRNCVPGLIPQTRFAQARIEYDRLLRLFERWKPDFASDDRDAATAP